MTLNLTFLREFERSDRQRRRAQLNAGSPMRRRRVREREARGNGNDGKGRQRLYLNVALPSEQAPRPGELSLVLNTPLARDQVKQLALNTARGRVKAATQPLCHCLPLHPSPKQLHLLCANAHTSASSQRAPLIHKPHQLHIKSVSIPTLEGGRKKIKKFTILLTS